MYKYVIRIAWVFVFLTMSGLIAETGAEPTNDADIPEKTHAEKASPDVPEHEKSDEADEEEEQKTAEKESEPETKSVEQKLPPHTPSEKNVEVPEHPDSEDREEEEAKEEEPHKSTEKKSKEEHKDLSKEAPGLPKTPAPEEQVSYEDIKIDTIDLSEPKGNWLMKRWWWEQAEISYEKIQQVGEQIFEERANFLKKRIELDKTVFMPFFKNIGIEQGELNEIIDNLIAKIEAERTEDELLSAEEREFLDVLQEERETLEKLKSDVDAIVEIDIAIDDALLKLIDQMGRARKYEQEGWNHLKTIARELNDQQAYILYEEMKSALRNINDILVYIRQSFAPYFNALIKKVVDRIDIVQNTVRRLKERGVNFKKEAFEREQAEEQAQICKKEPKPEQSQKPVELRWYEYILQPFKSFGNYIYSFFSPA